MNTKDITISLGVDAETGESIEIPLIELTRHVNIIGDSGTGKSNVNALLLSQLPETVTAEWVDSKRESHGLLDLVPGGVILKPTEFCSNPLEPIGAPATSWASRFEKIAPLLKIDDRTWPELATVLVRTSASMSANEPPPSLTDLILILKRLGETESPKFLTAAERLHRLASALGPAARVRQGPELASRYHWVGRDYFGQDPAVSNTMEAINLDKAVQNALISERSGGLKQLRLYDEGLDFFSREFTSTKAGSGHVSYQKRATSQVRSCGIGIVTCFQYPTQVDSSVTGNAATVIVLGQTDPKEAKYASMMLTGCDRLAKDILNLQRGAAFISNSNLFRDVRCIQIPEVPRSAPKASEVAARMAPEIEWLRSHSIMSAAIKDELSPIPYHEIVSGCSVASGYPDEIPDDWRHLLSSLRDHPSFSVVQHYESLLWSAGKGTRVKNAMLNSGFLRCQRRPGSNGRPALLLVPTKAGEELYSRLFDTSFRVNSAAEGVCSG